MVSVTSCMYMQQLEVVQLVNAGDLQCHLQCFEIQLCVVTQN